jgi:uncharacterized damage-inducible protein DinB
MSSAENALKAYAFHRTRTLDLLDRVLKEPNPQAALAWRPGPGRAHIAWQLMHIGVTEELFASERLAPEKPGAFKELWPRFRGGSTPDDDIPSADLIRKVLDESRAHLTATLTAIPDSRLEEVAITLRDRPFTFQQVFHLIGWHEAHHQGQAHCTLNGYKAAAGK